MSSNSIRVQTNTPPPNASHRSPESSATLPPVIRPQAGADRRILNSWKEIASYMGRGVRTVQRYEQVYQLPVRRPARKNRSAVVALSHEIDAWLTSIPTRPLGYVKPVLLILDSYVAGILPQWRNALQNAGMNVLTASDVEEALATANKFDVDGFVFDCQNGEASKALKDRFPKKPRFLMVPESYKNGNSPTGDYTVPARDPVGLVNIVRAVLGAQANDSRFRENLESGWNSTSPGVSQRNREETKLRPSAAAS